MATYKGHKIPEGYVVAFTGCTPTAAKHYATGARSGRFGRSHDRNAAKVMKIGNGKYDYIVVIKRSRIEGKPNKPMKHPK